MLIVSQPSAGSLSRCCCCSEVHWLIARSTGTMGLHRADDAARGGCDQNGRTCCCAMMKIGTQAGTRGSHAHQLDPFGDLCPRLAALPLNTLCTMAITTCSTGISSEGHRPGRAFMQQGIPALAALISSHTGSHTFCVTHLCEAVEEPGRLRPPPRAEPSVLA